ncbi:MAG: GNAT family N-acetyltransferase [Alkalibacterium sp.]|nr:GNAT family N-acetyltransferase [Alkalibacterium sp.]TVP91802.1 MAG: GNAT family N-acetyltransferase [Alkalibacterium sp.]
MNEIKIITAETDDLDLINSLLYDTALWIKEKGSTQWAGLLKGEDVHGVSSAIERNEVHLVYLNSELVGTLALWDKQTDWDSDLWGENDSREFYYLHRIAVEKNQHGKDRGKLLIDAAKRLCKSNGKKGIRLDCIASKPYLNNFYEANGFHFVKTIYNYDNGEGLQDYNLYQIFF